MFEVLCSPASHTATWTNISYDFGDLPVTDLVRDDVLGDLYAASDFGVLMLASGSTSWVLAAPGMPSVEAPRSSGGGLACGASWDRGGMSDNENKEELERDELEEQEGEELPDREAMSIIDVPGHGLGPPEFESPQPLPEP